MTAEPMRFIHAANLQVDCPLQDTGPLPDELQAVVKSATLTAWDRIVEACLNRDTDFLLLAGNSFDEFDPGVRSQAALIAGCERLDAAGVPVFIVPGPRDPVSAWLPGLRLPDNVTLFDQPGVETVDIDGDDGRLATLHGVSCSAAKSGPDWPNWLAEKLAATRSTSAGHAPHVALLPCGMSETDTDNRFTLSRGQFSHLINQRSPSPPVRYWACGENVSRLTFPIRDAVAHAPGSPQGLSPAEVGPRGATLIEIEATGAVRLDLIPTAPVRWERCVINLDHASTCDDLLLLMRSALRNLDHHDSDRLWIVDWMIAMPEAVHRRFADDDAATSIRDQLLEHAGFDGVSIWSRRFRWQVIDASVETEPSASAAATSLELPHDRDIPLASEFRRLVTAYPQKPHWMTVRLQASALHGGSWETRMAELMNELDEMDVAEQARQLGDELFPVTTQTRRTVADHSCPIG